MNAFSSGVFETLIPSLIETGSALPQALLAYQLSILEVICRMSPSTVCPIVIDAPNQQGQDEVNLRKIYKFIAENQPPNTQLILGIEKEIGADFKGKRIETSTKFSLLREQDYESVHDEIFGLLKKRLRG